MHRRTQAFLLLLARATAQCTGPPRWTPNYAMRASLYTYCFGDCPLPWLALPNNTALGRFPPEAIFRS